MTANTTDIIDSLEGYVLDIKPYHSKLSDIIVEYEFFDDVNVQIDEQHTIRTLLNSIWSQEYIAGPAFATSRYPMRAMFSTPTFFHFLNNFSGSTFISDVNTTLGYKLFNQRYRKDFKLVKKNGIPQLEGHDFFHTDGAYSFTVLPEQKIVTTAFNGATINWDDPDYQLGDTTYNYTVDDSRDAAQSYKNTYSFDLGVLTFQTLTSFEQVQQFTVRFKGFNPIIQFGLYDALDNEIIIFEGSDLVSCLSNTLFVSFTPNVEIDFATIPIDTTVSTFTVEPNELSSGVNNLTLELINPAITTIDDIDLVITRDLSSTADVGKATITTKFDNNVKRFRFWKFIFTEQLLNGTPTDKPTFNVEVSEDNITWVPTNTQAFEGTTYSSSLINVIDLDVVDFTIDKKSASNFAIGDEYVVDTSSVASAGSFHLRAADGTSLIGTLDALVNVPNGSVFEFGNYRLTLETPTLVGTFSNVIHTFNLRDFVTQTQVIPTTIFSISNIQNTTLSEIGITIRSIGSIPSFVVSLAGNRNGIAVTNRHYSSAELELDVAIGSYFHSFVNTYNYADIELKIRPTRDIVVADSAPLENWSIVKVNPIGYSRPMMKLANVAELIINDLWPGIPAGDFTFTCTAPNTFTITDPNGITADNQIVGYNTLTPILFGGQSYFNATLNSPTGSTPYTSIVGDFYSVTIENPVAFTPTMALVFGYDLAVYDAPYYDTRFQHYNIGDINFTLTPQTITSILEIRAISNSEFTVTFFDKTDYNNGIRTQIGTYPNAIVDVLYSCDNCSFTIVTPSHPTDPVEFIADDVFFIDIENPDPSVEEGPWFSSIHNPFIHIYGTSYNDVDSKRWLFTATSTTEFTVASTPTSAFASSVMNLNVAYDNSEVHFTAYQSLIIPFTPGDEFYFDIFEQKPSYKVFGSVTGETSPAIVGEWYSNDKIAFMLEAPTAEVESAAGVLGGVRRVPVQRSYTTQYIKLDNERIVKFNRPIRNDALSDLYRFTYVARNNCFTVATPKGNRIGIDYATENEWTDRYSNSMLSQNASYDVKHADGKLAFTILKTNPISLAPISFTDGYEFKIQIKDHELPLYHSHNGILFKKIVGTDTCYIEDFSEDKLALSIDSTSAAVPSELGTKVTKYLEATDNTKNITDDLVSSAMQKTPHWGQDPFYIGGNKQYEIATYNVRTQEYADVGTVDIDVYSKNIPTLRIGSFRQKESGLRPTFSFDPNFSQQYMGVQGAKFNIKIEQGQMMNTAAKTKITESVKFAERWRPNDGENLQVHITDTLEFNSIWSGARFYDSFSVHLADAHIPILYNYGGYDTTDYDNETNFIAAQLGGPTDIDNDGIPDVQEPGNIQSYDSQYDFNLRYAQQGLGVFERQSYAEPSTAVAPRITESFIMYSLNTPMIFDETLFDEVSLDSGATATAITQMKPMYNAGADSNSPLYGRTYFDGVSNVPYTIASESMEIGKNATYNGSTNDLAIESCVINHPFGTSINRFIVVDNLTDQNEIPHSVTLLNTNSFTITPSVPRTFAVIVV